MAYEGRELAALQAISNRRLTKATEHLLGICEGILSDSKLNDSEIGFLNLWLRQYPEVTTCWPGTAIASRVQTVLSDGVITEDERQDLFNTLKGVCGFQLYETGSAESAVAEIPFDDDPSIWFDGRTFCFTGKFIFGTRTNCERVVQNLGAYPVNNVNSKLEYLVVGALIEPSWAHTSYGRKIEKVLQYKEKGYGISIVSERQWSEAMSL